MIQNLAVLKKVCNAISKKEKGEKPKNEKDEDASQFYLLVKRMVKRPFMFGKKYDTETEDVIKEAKVVWTWKTMTQN